MIASLILIGQALLGVSGVVGAGGSANPVLPQDFAIRLEWGVCFTDVADTFKGEYVRDLGSGNRVTAQIWLSEQEKEDLFQSITAVDFSNYPSDFRPQTDSLTEPMPHYRLTVRAGGKSHTVSWHDSGWGTPERSVPEAQRLRKMLNGMRDLFLDLPPVNALPKSTMICL
jgi:hypothetical protein